MSDGFILDVKVVPNASRDQIVGFLGAALKVKVAAPPEAGKANAAVCALIAKAMKIKPRDVQVIAGQSQPNKRLRISGMSQEQAMRFFK